LENSSNAPSRFHHMKLEPMPNGRLHNTDTKK
jgi:hypothetical protein